MSVLQEVVNCFRGYEGQLFQIVKQQESETSAELFVRVLGRDPDWKSFILRILTALKTNSKASQFIGTSYFSPNPNELKWGWVICLYGTDSVEDFLQPLQAEFVDTSQALIPEGQVGPPQISVATRSDEQAPSRAVQVTDEETIVPLSNPGVSGRNSRGGGAVPAIEEIARPR